jgi:protein translocase SecG subunit
MNIPLSLAQIILSVLITGAILLQAQGSGLGSTWGGGGETYHTKRGVERVVFYFTIFAIGVFVVLSLVSLRLSAHQ